MRRCICEMHFCQEKWQTKIRTARNHTAQLLRLLGVYPIAQSEAGISLPAMSEFLTSVAAQHARPTSLYPALNRAKTGLPP